MGVDRVNLVREGFEAWNSEDPQWVLEHMHPEVEWGRRSGTIPRHLQGPRGRAGVFWTRWRNAVGQLRFAPEEVIDGGEHVVVIAHRWGHNEITGLQISDKVAQVFSFDDDDKCVRVQEFHDRGTALKAAGLDTRPARL